MTRYCTVSLDWQFKLMTFIYCNDHTSVLRSIYCNDHTSVLHRQKHEKLSQGSLRKVLDSKIGTETVYKVREITRSGTNKPTNKQTNTQTPRSGTRHIHTYLPTYQQTHLID
jgi:hypothetical protein